MPERRRYITGKKRRLKKKTKKMKSKTFTATTYAEPAKPLTVKDLKGMAELVQKIEEPTLHESKWFTRVMNKLGWHRKYECIIIDKDKFKFPKLVDKSR